MSPFYKDPPIIDSVILLCSELIIMNCIYHDPVSNEVTPEVLGSGFPTGEFVGGCNSEVLCSSKPLTGGFPKNRAVDLPEAREQVVRSQ